MNSAPRLLVSLLDQLMIVFGVLCLVLAIAAHFGRFSARMDILTHFAPLLLVGAAVVSLYGLVGSFWSLRPTHFWLGLGTVFATLALILPEYTRPISPPASGQSAHQIKIIQLNAWTRNRDVKGTARWLADQNADIIALEEPTAALKDEIKRLTGMHFTRGILSSGIFTHDHNPKSPFQLGEPWHEWPDLTRTSILVGGHLCPVVAVHLTWPTDPWQAKQLASLRKIPERADRARLIIVGDFNLTPWSFALRRLDHDLGLTRRDRAIFSWPAQPIWGRRLSSPIPFLPIDHIYAGSAWRTVKIERGPRLGSDHFPLIITLALED